MERKTYKYPENTSNKNIWKRKTHKYPENTSTKNMWKGKHTNIQKTQVTKFEPQRRKFLNRTLQRLLKHDLTLKI